MPIEPIITKIPTVAKIISFDRTLEFSEFEGEGLFSGRSGGAPVSIGSSVCIKRE